MPKFMQSLDEKVFKKLEEIAEKRGITVQELIRAVIIPAWLESLASAKDAQPRSEPPHRT